MNDHIRVNVTPLLHPHGHKAFNTADGYAFILHSDKVAIVNHPYSLITEYPALESGLDGEVVKPWYLLKPMAPQVFRVIKHPWNLMLLELLPGETILIDVFFPTAKTNFAIFGLPNIRVPAVGWALSDDGPVAYVTVEIPEVRPMFIIQCLFAGNPVIVLELIIRVQVDLLRLVPRTVVDLQFGVILVPTDGLSAFVTISFLLLFCSLFR
jgi:hypothetical protein